MFSLSQLQLVNRIEDVNVDSMLQTSLPSMKGGTYVWPSHIDTDELRISFYKHFLQLRLLSHNCFAFKRVVDGRDVSFNVGYRDENDYWVYVHALVDNINGSRNWIFDPNITPQQTQFLIDANFKGIIISSFGESEALMHQLAKYEPMSDMVTVHERWKEVPDKGLLLTKIDFIQSN